MANDRHVGSGSAPHSLKQLKGTTPGWPGHTAASGKHFSSGNVLFNVIYSHIINC